MSGLTGVVACETSICSIEEGTLRYRGYTIDDLAYKSFTYYGMAVCRIAWN